MNYNKFTFTNNDYVIEFTKKEFSRTDSGKSWKKNPDTVSYEFVTPEFYTNYIQAVPFFNNFGGRACCRAYCDYTTAGYIPTDVTTISPDGSKKITARFVFTYKW